MNRILLIEDDPVLGRGLSVNLELEGYQVQWVRDLKSAMLAREREKDAFGLVLVDLGLPDGSGLTFLKALRGSQKKEEAFLPVVILTAQTDEDSVVEGLQAGANDYVRKPFGNRELLARIKTTLREPVSRGQQARYDELVVWLEERKATWKGKEIELTPRGFDLLAYFILHAEKVVARETLLQSFDSEAEIYDRTIDSHVSHLRSRLKKAGVVEIQLSSVYGVGYRLEKIEKEQVEK